MYNPFEEIVQRLNSIEDLLKNIGVEGLSDFNNKKEADIISGEELCKKLGLTIQTLIRWRQKGKVPFLQIGSSIRYDLNKVIEALEKKDKVKKVEALTFKYVKMTQEEPLPLRDLNRKYSDFIYIMKNNENGRFKIGISNNPQVRERTLMSAEPDIKLIHQWAGCKTDEENLHIRFSNCKIRGEWFSLNEFQINEIVAYMKGCDYELPKN